VSSANERDFAAVIADLDALRGQLAELVNGNGHPGFRNLLDDIYGNELRSRRGLLPRVAAVEQKVNELVKMRDRDITLLKGVAIGVGYVVLDTTGLIGIFMNLIRQLGN
jgi:hypothetical protein